MRSRSEAGKTAVLAELLVSRSPSADLDERCSAVRWPRRSIEILVSRERVRDGPRESSATEEAEGRRSLEVSSE